MKEPKHYVLSEKYVDFESNVEWKKFEKKVFNHLLDNRPKYGIDEIHVFENMVVDGAVKLESRKVILLEIKFGLNWLADCNARIEFYRFLREKRVQDYFTQHISNKAPEEAWIVFDHFSGDWRRKGWSNFREEEGILRPCPIPIRIRQLTDEGLIELSLEAIVKICGEAITREYWYDDAECTNRLLVGFSRFAESLGFRAQYSGHPKEFLTIDMVWWDDGRIVAAIESENVPGTKPIEDEWKKLTYVDADYRILISYCTPEDMRKKLLKQASETITRNPRVKNASFFLLLGDETLYRFRGYEFDDSGKLVKKIDLASGSVVDRSTLDPFGKYQGLL